MFILIYFVFIVFLGAMIYGYKKNKPVFFWLAFFVIVLLPTLTPFKISWVVAERYVYLGSLGIFVVIAMLFDKIASFNVNAKMVAYTAIVLIVASLSARTIVRNKDWKSEDSLWFATARVAPSGQNIHNNLGDVYARNGNYEKAIEEFTKATQINPNYADAYHNLANTYGQIGNYNEAMANYQKALEFNPKLWQSYQNLGSIYADLGNFDLAAENMKKAIEINPQDPNLRANLEKIEEMRTKNDQPPPE
jgi:tetratricopeptide (TPR) repeat protein